MLPERNGNFTLRCCLILTLTPWLYSLFERAVRAHVHGDDKTGPGNMQFLLPLQQEAEASADGALLGKACAGRSALYRAAFRSRSISPTAHAEGCGDRDKIKLDDRNDKTDHHF
jgi:hypothetical protein